MSDWVGDTSEYRPWKELVYQSDPDDPDFVPPESESDVVDSGIESGDEGDGDVDSAGGDDSDSDSESEKDGGGDNNDRNRENDGEGDRDEIRRKRPRQEDEEGEEGQREKKPRGKEKKDLHEEDIMERFDAHRCNFRNQRLDEDEP
ncbi:uncharacterized protein LOC110229843 [Arabidopsis lyrata subsp. lyrata]|uniref:uncharacterized protein LOC110229843 n=1 Tax=Arabidopsis lyrata subsp. lyrata TaxID=81972 RepID=UPI000A29EAC2|nr:uncharacterized protein LOC110229843 [Arabidopsis lyrata subsp. lyrata]|eukprot:XP_020886526.1 uncharacterized protein LOC110229843 [Arabidopsis lyrata subsp. lyrata]